MYIYEKRTSMIFVVKVKYDAGCKLGTYVWMILLKV